MLDKRPDNMQRITTKELALQFIDEQVNAVRAQVGDGKVLLALSGGVDSSVVAALLIKAIGKQLVCVHVNHGLMRKGESEQVIEVFGKELDANLIYVDATDRFLDLLKDVKEPEKKRKIIGGEFIKVFDEEARKLSGVDIGKGQSRVGQRLLGQHTDVFDMTARRDLGHHAAVELMFFHLRIDERRQHAPSVFHHGCRRFVAGAFNCQYLHIFPSQSSL